MRSPKRDQPGGSRCLQAICLNCNTGHGHRECVLLHSVPILLRPVVTTVYCASGILSLVPSSASGQAMPTKCYRWISAQMESG